VNGIVELPSFVDTDTSRPTVQMPPLAERREPPPSIDEAFDDSFDDTPTPTPTPTPAREPEPEPDRPRVSTLLGMAPIAARRPPAAPPLVLVEPTLPGGIG
jgi:hypothetical protein